MKMRELLKHKHYIMFILNKSKKLKTTVCISVMFFRGDYFLPLTQHALKNYYEPVNMRNTDRLLTNQNTAAFS